MAARMTASYQTGAGTTPIVAGSGTGAYRGIRGGFPVTLTLNEVEATTMPVQETGKRQPMTNRISGACLSPQTPPGLGDEGSLACLEGSDDR
jgi:hypothetical protein